MRKGKWILSIFLVVAMIMVGCTSKGNEQNVGAQTPNKSNSNSGSGTNDTNEQNDVAIEYAPLVLALDSDPAALDPAYVADGPSASVIANVMEGLTGFNPKNGELIPVLAEDWDAEEGGKVFTFNLRKNVKFHDGTPFDAEAVKFNFERQMEGNRTEDMPNAPSIYGNVEKVEAIDEHTFKVTLSKPDVVFLANLAKNPGSQIVSPTALQEDAEGFKKNPVGTGPYTFNKWEAGQYVMLDANKDYWGGEVKTPQLVFKIITDSAVRTSELLAGSVDILGSVDINDLERLESAGINVISSPGSTINYIALYTDREPFNDKRVRQALAMGVDREAIVKGLYGDHAIVANGPIPPNTLGYFGDLEPLPYDPEKAQQLLKEAGYEDGLTFTMLAYNVTKNYNPAAEKLALALANELEKINVKVDVIIKPWNEFVEDLFAEDKQGHSIQIGWGSTIGDPSDFIMLLESANGGTGLNFAQFKNDKLDELAAQAIVTVDPEERAAIYKEIQVIFNEEVPWLLFSHSIDYAAASQGVHGYVPGRGAEKFVDVYKEK